MNDHKDQRGSIDEMPSAMALQDISLKLRKLADELADLKDRATEEVGADDSSDELLPED
ncbi:hypothetical protein [Ensifer sp. Root127]|jgi:hypothetical protein|uniref:hypothetical protein n=1 Tax=Ensifer sp. Root127 TaxID=1736440 RepID=UPI000A72F1F9|nr:hypothetical protein [Ensifer sp. Root127]